MRNPRQTSVLIGDGSWGSFPLLISFHIPFMICCRVMILLCLISRSLQQLLDIVVFSLLSLSTSFSLDCNDFRSESFLSSKAVIVFLYSMWIDEITLSMVSKWHRQQCVDGTWISTSSSLFLFLFVWFSMCFRNEWKRLSHILWRIRGWIFFL